MIPALRVPHLFRVLCEKGGRDRDQNRSFNRPREAPITAQLRTPSAPISVPHY